VLHACLIAGIPDITKVNFDFTGEVRLHLPVMLKKKSSEKMKHPRMQICCLAVLVFLVLSAIPAQADVVRAFVSIAPQKYFVQKIGGELVTVSVLVPGSADPHTYEPKPRQMMELAKSAVYFAVGVDFERVWLPKIAPTNPGMLIIHTEEGIEKIPMSGRNHEHAGDAHNKSSAVPDPHIWLSPASVKIQAGHILQALIKLDPKNQTRYKNGYTAFLREIDALDAELKALFAGRKNKQFIVFHPSWGYLARDYGLKQVPIEIEGKDPKPAQLQMLIHHAREQGIKVVFVQPQFSSKSAAMVARAIEGRVIYVNPLAEDWAENLRDVAQKFSDSIR
jgi:zinc transport system substrate-binding protein